MIELSVNIDHVATVRQARRISEPDPVAAAVLAELGGADGITVHLREDRRHAQDRDVRLLRETVGGELNLEMACSEEIIRIALDVRPGLITLVPERREEITTEGGLDLRRRPRAIAGAVARFRKAGMKVSFFIDPDEAQIKLARKLEADFVELHTGEYAECGVRSAECGVKSEIRNPKSEIERLCDGAAAAATLGLGVHAGHGLNYRNVQPVAAIPQVTGLYIGHSIVGRAIFVGMQQAVREMKELMRQAREGPDA
ncbi:MAG: pyridoxine 5'-phosphate synthase [Planctomycetes bacterium]|nr:pyridoxine 5'-phosphate synthase [Planctomycetota bacterium]